MGCKNVEIVSCDPNSFLWGVHLRRRDVVLSGGLLVDGAVEGPPRVASGDPFDHLQACGRERAGEVRVGRRVGKIMSCGGNVAARLSDPMSGSGSAGPPDELDLCF